MKIMFDYILDAILDSVYRRQRRQVTLYLLMMAFLLIVLGYFLLSEMRFRGQRQASEEVVELGLEDDRGGDSEFADWLNDADADEFSELLALAEASDSEGSQDAAQKGQDFEGSHSGNLALKEGGESHPTGSRQLASRSAGSENSETTMLAPGRRDSEASDFKTREADSDSATSGDGDAGEDSEFGAGGRHVGSGGKGFRNNIAPDVASGSAAAQGRGANISQARSQTAGSTLDSSNRNRPSTRGPAANPRRGSWERIGPAGGSLSLGGAKVVIPPEALSRERQLYLLEHATRPPEEFESLSAVFELGPPSLKLNHPVEVSLTAIGDPTLTSLILIPHGKPPIQSRGLVSGRKLSTQISEPGQLFIGLKKGEFVVTSRSPPEELGCTEGSTRVCYGQTQRCAFEGISRCISGAWSSCSGCCNYDRTVTRPGSERRRVCRMTPRGEECHYEYGQVLHTRTESARDCQ